MEKKLKFVATNYKVSPWPLSLLAEFLSYHASKLLGKNYSGEKVVEWKGGTNRWALDSEEFNEMSKLALEKIEKDQKWAWEITKEIPKACDGLIKFTKKVFNSDLSKKTNEEIFQLYDGYRNEFINMYAYAWLPNASEGLDGVFTKKLEGYLKDNLDKKDQLGKYLSILTTPLKDSIRQKEEKEFLKVILKKGEKFEKMLDKHLKEYCWLSFDYEGPAWNRDFFIERARRLQGQKVSSSREIDEMIKERNKIKKLQKDYLREVGLDKDKHFKYLFDLARELMYLKDYRKDILFKSYYQMDKLIKEISRRLGLSVAQVRHILPDEMKNALLENKFDTNELNERIKHTVLVYNKDGVKVYTGKEAADIIDTKIIKEETHSDVRELQGSTAYPGSAKGKVRIILTDKDMPNMQEGEILVSVSTTPNLLPIMKKAKAIITDKGGITSHAAIMSRELRIPCVTGTNIASEVLEDGDEVEVDANEGIVKKIS